MDFKKRLIEKLDLSTIAANTMYSVYIDVCEDVAKEYSAKQNKELLKENEKMLIDFCKSRMGERQWSLSSGYELRAINDYLNNIKTHKK